jgi:polyribonucleotide nucleotidyltransferase
MKKRAIYQGKDYEIIFELNDWAERAPVSLKVQSGGTLILVTALLGEEHPELDFVPLTVEYDERYYAVGKIFGSRFIRRETRPSNFAILNARLVDRALRSALPSNFRRSLQIINVVLSYDRKNVL